MNYVSIVCDLIQIVCWFCVLYYFIRLFRERRKLLYDNLMMFKALLDINCMNDIEEMRSKASEVLELTTEEVKE